MSTDSSSPTTMTAAMEERHVPSLAATDAVDDETARDACSSLITLVVDCSNSVHSTTNSVDSGIALNEDVATNSDDLANDDVAPRDADDGRVAGEVDDVANSKSVAASLPKRSHYQFRFLARHVQRNSYGGVVYKCDVCDATYRRRYSLKRHFVRSHINRKYVAETKSGEDADDPMAATAEEDTAAANADEPAKEMPGLYRCCHCDLLFDELEEIKGHHLKHARPNGKKTSSLSSFTCVKCHAKFSRRQNYEQHLEIHSVAVYPCSQCEASFSVSINLSRHEREHRTGNYLCDYCPSEKRTVDELREHFESNHPAKYYDCSFCERRFVRGCEFECHLFKEHDETLASNAAKTKQDDASAAVTAETNSLGGKLSVDDGDKTRDKNFLESDNSESDSDDLTNDRMTEKERLIIQHKKSSEGKHHRWRRGFAFACTICKKRFRDYARMCAHRRLAHQRHLIQRRRFQYKRTRVVEMDPRERQKLEQFYAGVVGNVAENLRLHIDGVAASLANPSRFYRVVPVHDFTGAAAANDAEFWKRFNFRSDYPRLVWRHLCQIEDALNCDIQIKTEPPDAIDEKSLPSAEDSSFVSVKNEPPDFEVDNNDLLCSHNIPATSENVSCDDSKSFASGAPAIEEEAHCSLADGLPLRDEQPQPSSPVREEITTKSELEAADDERRAEDVKNEDDDDNNVYEKTTSEKMWIDSIHVSDISDDDDDRDESVEVHISDISLEYISTVNKLSANLVSNQYMAPKPVERFSTGAYALSPVKSFSYVPSAYVATGAATANLALSDISDEDDRSSRGKTDDVRRQPPKLEIHVSDISSDEDDEFADAVDDRAPPFLTRCPPPTATMTTYDFMLASRPTAMKTILDYSLNPVRNVYPMSSEFADYPKHDFNSAPSRTTIAGSCDKRDATQPSRDWFDPVSRNEGNGGRRWNALNDELTKEASTGDTSTKSEPPMTHRISNTPVSELSFNAAADDGDDEDDDDGDDDVNCEEAQLNGDHDEKTVDRCVIPQSDLGSVSNECALAKDAPIERDQNRKYSVTTSDSEQITTSEQFQRELDRSSSESDARNENHLQRERLAYFNLCRTDSPRAKIPSKPKSAVDKALFNSNPLLPFVSKNSTEDESKREDKDKVARPPDPIDAHQNLRHYEGLGSVNSPVHPSSSSERPEDGVRLPPTRYMYDDYDIRVSFMCLVCDAEFSNSWDLSNHQLDVHETVDCRHIQMEKDCSTDLPRFIVPKPSVDGALDGLGKFVPENPYSECINCTKCRETFGDIGELRAHIMYCATGTRSKSNSRVYYRKGYKRGRNKLGRRTRQGPKMKRQTPVKPTENASAVAAGRRRGHLAVLRLGDSDGAKRDLSEVTDGTGKRRRRRRNQNPDQIPYNPKRHVRRRELRQCIDMQTCWGCGKKFSNLPLLERHSKTCDQRDVIQKRKLSRQDENTPSISTVAQQQAEEVEETKPDAAATTKKPGVPLRCPYCSKNFIYRTHLRTHLREICSVKQNLLTKDLLTADHVATENQLLKSVFNNEYAGDVQTVELSAEDAVKQAEKIMKQGRQKRLLWMRGNRRKETNKRNKSWASLKHLKSARKTSAKINNATTTSLLSAPPSKFGTDDVYAYPESTDGEDTMPSLVHATDTSPTNSLQKRTPRRKTLIDNDPYYMKTFDQRDDKEKAVAGGNKRRRKRTFKALMLENGMYPEIDGRKCRAVNNKRKRIDSLPDPENVESVLAPEKVPAPAPAKAAKKDAQKQREPVEDDPEKYVYSLPDENGVVKIWKRRGPKPKWLKAMETKNPNDKVVEPNDDTIKAATENGAVIESSETGDILQPLKVKNKRRSKAKAKIKEDSENAPESISITGAPPLKPISLKLKMKRNSKSKWSRSNPEEGTVDKSKVEDVEQDNGCRADDVGINSESAEPSNQPKKKLKLKITKNSDGKMSASVDEASKLGDAESEEAQVKKKRKRFSQKNLDGLYDLMKELEVRDIEKRQEEIVFRSDKAGPKPVWMRKLISIYTSRKSSGDSEPNPADKTDLAKLIETHCAEKEGRQRAAKKRKPKMKGSLKDIANAAQCAVTDQANRLKELAEAAKVAVTEKIQMHQSEPILLEADIDLSAPLVIDFQGAADVDIKVPRKKRVPKKFLDNVDDAVPTVDSSSAVCNNAPAKTRKKPGPKTGCKRGVKKAVDGVANANTAENANAVHNPPAKIRRKPGPKPGYKRKKKTLENVPSVADVIPSESGQFVVIKDIYDFDDESCLRSSVPSVGVVSPLKLKTSLLNPSGGIGADECELIINESKS
ncbi:uncharacterized protein LOC141908563 [Tubulanus polymorphus]|uniref:uncharacterized protein LOC141908563 n=1 Tax=Tubulanus polymorphus TaxID=672921 RepID=UPI003DA5B16D